jgi:hypothetical protein
VSGCPAANPGVERDERLFVELSQVVGDGEAEAPAQVEGLDNRERVMMQRARQRLGLRLREVRCDTLDVRAALTGLPGPDHKLGEAVVESLHRRCD